jgi:hypothetical protein
MEIGCSRTELDQKAQAFSTLDPRAARIGFDFGVFWAERSKRP